jgi:hypothetical protein
MTEIETIIKDSIEGGWDRTKSTEHMSQGALVEFWLKEPRRKYEALLDPKFWEAVGKVRGWWTVTPVGMFEFGGSPYAKGYEGRYEKYQAKQEWCYKMIVFMYYRADGLTIEAALTKLK